MPTFTAIFLLVLALSTGIHLWLNGRQRRHVTRNRAQVPPQFADRVSLAAHQKAADYTLAKTRFDTAHTLYGATLLVVWTLGGGLELVDALWRGADLGPIATGTGFMITVFLVGSLLDLPFTLYNTFGIEQRFGFNRSTTGVFIGDLAKQYLLAMALGAPLAAVVLWLMQDSSPLWWLHVWGVWMLFTLVMVWAYPALIAPLFNKFSPLKDRELVLRIEKLLDRCGFHSKGIFVMDGSRRSSHGNAYFTGLGPNKRIVFFDTLLETLGPDEIEAVLAHELGHFRRHHVRKRLATMMGIAFVGLAILGWLIEQPWFYQGLGVSHPATHTALMLFLLITPVFTFFLQPIFSLTMRRHEFEADEFAAENASARDLIQALVKLYRDNASTLTPDPWYSAFHHSHPPAPVRVAHLSARAR